MDIEYFAKLSAYKILIQKIISCNDTSAKFNLKLYHFPYIHSLSHYSLNEYVLHDSNHGYLLELAKHPRTSYSLPYMMKHVLLFLSQL